MLKSPSSSRTDPQQTCGRSFHAGKWKLVAGYIIATGLENPKQNAGKALKWCPCASQIRKQATFSSTTVKIPDAHATAASPCKPQWLKHDTRQTEQVQGQWGPLNKCINWQYQRKCSWAELKGKMPDRVLKYKHRQTFFPVSRTTLLDILKKTVT